MKDIKKEVLEEMKKSGWEIRYYCNEDDMINMDWGFDPIELAIQKTIAEMIGEIEKLENPEHQCKDCDWRGVRSDMSYDSESCEWFCPRCDTEFENIGQQSERMILRELKKKIEEGLK